MTYYITGYNGVDLQATCGVVTPEVSGVHDLPALDVSTRKLPGGVVPHMTVLPDGFRNIPFGVVMEGPGHDALVDHLEALRGYLRPDNDFHPLVVADRPTQRIMALCVEGFRVSTDHLPGDFDVVKFKTPFLCYPYWEDLTERTVLVASTFLSFRQATFEAAALGDCGWHVLDAGLPTSVTTSPYAGDYCMQVVTDGSNATDGAKTPEAGIAGITAAEVYSVSLWAKGAAGGETVQLAIRFFNAASEFISEVTSNLELTAAWAQYKFENQAAPALATKASLQLRDAHAATWFVDNVCLEEAAACGAFITPHDANTKVYNGGDMVCYPVYTCSILDTLALGLTLTVDSKEFAYDGELVATDVLVCDTDPQLPDVELNGTRDWANTDIDSAFPPLAVGWNTVALSDSSKFSLAMAFRQRYT